MRRTLSIWCDAVDGLHKNVRRADGRVVTVDYVILVDYLWAVRLSRSTYLIWENLR